MLIRRFILAVLVVSSTASSGLTEVTPTTHSTVDPQAIVAEALRAVHVADYFDMTPEEKTAVMELVEQGKALLDRELKPDGYNVGINSGLAAGQTIMHAHVHLIPRYRADTDDPRGGVRGVIPEKQKY